MRGTIRREHTAWCGECGCWDRTTEARSMGEAAEAFRLGGWRRSRDRGWTCPACIKEKERDHGKAEER